MAQLVVELLRLGKLLVGLYLVLEVGHFCQCFRESLTHVVGGISRLDQHTVIVPRTVNQDTDVERRYEYSYHYEWDHKSLELHTDDPSEQM